MCPFASMVQMSGSPTVPPSSVTAICLPTGNPAGAQGAPLGDLGDPADLVDRVDGAEIARLGEADRRRLAAMDLARLDPGEHLAQRLGGDPAVAAGHRHELEPAAEKPGGVRLRGVDM